MNILDRLPIRARVVLVILTSVLGAEIAMSVVILWSDLRDLRRSTASSAVMNARLIAEYSVAPLIFSDRDGARSVLDKALSLQALDGICVFDSSGDEFVCAGGSAVAPLPGNGAENYAASSRYNGRTLHVSAPVRFDGRYLGQISMRVSTLDTGRVFARRVVAHALVILLISALSVALALRLERVISRPILSLARLTKDITRKGDFTVRIAANRTDELGELYRNFDGLLQKIRDKEAERDTAEMALRTSEQRMRAILDGMPDMIFTFDRNGVFQGAAGAREWLLKRPEDFLGKYIRDVMPKDIAEATIKHLALALETRRTQVFEYRIDISSSTRHFEARMIPTGANEAFALVRDMTERRKAEAQLLQAQKMETVGALSSGLAHDFNNVLAGISSTVSLLEISRHSPEGVLPNELEESLEIITMATNRAAEIVRQLLSFSRRTDIRPLPIDLNDTVANALAICRNSVDKSVVLDFRTVSGQAVVNADPTQMEQVLLNLCVNAEHAMTFMRPSSEHRGGKLSVQLEHTEVDDQFAAAHPRAVAGKSYWRMRIEDTGVGMDRHTIERAFDPFFTTKDKQRGTGLGLATVYNIIESHGGFLDVYSEPGKGSTFSVYIPAADAQTASAAIERADLPKASAPATVLIVDDEDLIRKSAGRVLTECGYSIITATSGREGVQVYTARKSEIDIILLDLSMPGLSGKETFDLLREFDPYVRVVMSSGLRQDPRVDESLAAGVQGFVQKPYTINALVDELERVLGRLA